MSPTLRILLNLVLHQDVNVEEAAPAMASALAVLCGLHPEAVPTVWKALRDGGFSVPEVPCEACWADSLIEASRSEQVLDACPHNGVGYSIARQDGITGWYLSPLTAAVCEQYGIR